MFDIGEKVICINDTWQPWVRDTYNQLPIKGQVYTIRELDLGRDNLGTIASGDAQPTYKVLLEELVNDVDVTASGRVIGELGFRSDRFASLDKLEEVMLAEAGEAVEVTKVIVQ